MRTHSTVYSGSGELKMGIYLLGNLMALAGSLAMLTPAAAQTNRPPAASASVGIAPWHDFVRTKRAWHFAFYEVRHVPALLIAGPERRFITCFHNSEPVNSPVF